MDRLKTDCTSVVRMLQVCCRKSGGLTCEQTSGHFAQTVWVCDVFYRGAGQKVATEGLTATEAAAAGGGSLTCTPSVATLCLPRSLAPLGSP